MHYMTVLTCGNQVTIWPQFKKIKQTNQTHSLQRISLNFRLQKKKKKKKLNSVNNEYLVTEKKKKNFDVNFVET